MANYKLKSLSQDALAEAMNKAERYRLLNEPREAESICRDVLDADPNNLDAKITLILTLTDRFMERKQEIFDDVFLLIDQLEDEYERVYYSAVAWERWGKAQFVNNAPGHVVYEWIRKAMDHFEKAEQISPMRSAAAVIRWNTCARMLNTNESICACEEAAFEPLVVDEDMPMR